MAGHVLQLAAGEPLTVTHPTWCIQTPECTDPDHQAILGWEHLGLETRFQPEGLFQTAVGLQLVRFDDMSDAPDYTPVVAESSRVRLRVSDGDPDGAANYADLNAADALLLARQLVIFAGRIQDEPGGVGLLQTPAGPDAERLRAQWRTMDRVAPA